MLSRGEVLYFLKRAADALVAIEPLAAEGVPPDIRARALYYVGKINADSGNTDAAVKSLKTLIEALPENPLAPFARYQLAFVYLTRKETENAAVEFAAVANSRRTFPTRRSRRRPITVAHGRCTTRASTPRRQRPAKRS